MLAVDAEQLTLTKRGEYLDLLVRLDHPGRGGLSLADRVAAALADARVRFPEPYIDLDGPVPWSEDAMVRIAYRGPRRARLAELLSHFAQHPVWEGIVGELVRAPTQRSGIDKPEITGLTAGLRLGDRDVVPPAQYPPADTPPALIDEVLAWVGVGHASRVFISTWKRDRRIEPVRVRSDLERALRWTSDIAVVTFEKGTFRRVVLNRDCVLASVSCQDAEDRARELERFADLFPRCRAWVTFAAVNPNRMIVHRWRNFFSALTNPPYSPYWEDVLDAPKTLVPDVFALQMLTPAHGPLQLGPAWRMETTVDGYRIIEARDPEPWLTRRSPDHAVLTAGRAEFDSIIVRGS